MTPYSFIRPFLFLLSPEFSHNLAHFALRNHLCLKQPSYHDSVLESSLWGIHFRTPVGMAAGFDKNAEIVDSLFHQGFSFVEAGTVTPKAQPGNPKPRLFRLAKDEAIINRMGFNNKGAHYFLDHVKKRKHAGIFGINIGKNKSTSLENAFHDYRFLLEYFYGFCDYFTLNISSPNTPGLRALFGHDYLNAFLGEIMSFKKTIAKKEKKHLPVLLKLSPDEDASLYEYIASCAMHHGIDGLIISNTTIKEKEKLNGRYHTEDGGLSGKPILERSNDTLSLVYKITKGAIPIIGVGGISSGDDAYKKIRLGASLLQIYSCIVYHGFGIVPKINQRLAFLLKQDGFTSLQSAVGVDNN